MRQVIALVANGTVKYAVVDDGEVMQFAEVLLPPTFGLAEAAVLGANLVETLGLDRAKPKPRAPQPPAVDAKQPKAKQAKRKVGSKGGSNAGPYISDQMVIDIINNSPGGVSIPQIGRIIAERDGLDYEWCRTSVNNRLVVFRERVKAGRLDRMPFIDGRQPNDPNKPLLRPYPTSQPAGAAPERTALQSGVQSEDGPS